MVAQHQQTVEDLNNDLESSRARILELKEWLRHATGLTVEDKPTDTVEIRYPKDIVITTIKEGNEVVDIKKKDLLMSPRNPVSTTQGTTTLSDGKVAVKYLLKSPLSSKPSNLKSPSLSSKAKTR